MNHCSITQVPRGQQKVLLFCEIHTSCFLKLVVPFEQNVISLLFSSCGMQDGPDLHRSSPGEDNYFFDWRHCFV